MSHFSAPTRPPQAKSFCPSREDVVVVLDAQKDNNNIPQTPFDDGDDPDIARGDPARMLWFIGIRPWERCKAYAEKYARDRVAEVIRAAHIWAKRSKGGFVRTALEQQWVFDWPQQPVVRPAPTPEQRRRKAIEENQRAREARNDGPAWVCSDRNVSRRSLHHV